jgi:hypothetical protein
MEVDAGAPVGVPHPLNHPRLSRNPCRCAEGDLCRSRARTDRRAGRDVCDDTGLRRQSARGRSGRGPVLPRLHIRRRRALLHRAHAERTRAPGGLHWDCLCGSVCGGRADPFKVSDGRRGTQTHAGRGHSSLFLFPRSSTTPFSIRSLAYFTSCSGAGFWPSP